jgi:hypothetical protein
MKHSFRSIKDATVLDSILPPKAAPSRVSLVSAGNPDVLREAAGLADYANPRKRRRGGRVKVDGHKPRPRLDRPSRGRKFADGGSADEQSDQSATSRGFVDALMASPKVRAIAAGLSGIQKVDQAISKETGTKPAYRRGGRRASSRV